MPEREKTVVLHLQAVRPDGTTSEGPQFVVSFRCSSTPVYASLTMIAGTQPGDASFKTVRIAPALDSLSAVHAATEAHANQFTIK